MQYFRPQDKRGLNVFETPKDPGRRVHRLQARLRRRRSPRRSRRSSHSNTAAPVMRQRRQRQPAGRHRLRLQQLDREPVPERAARARHPRRADELPVVAAPQRDVGQGRLPPDRRVADRLRAAQDADEDRHGPGRPLRDQLRRRALPPQRQRQRDLQPVRRQLHHGRVHDRDRRRGRTSSAKSVIAMGVDDRRRDCAARSRRPASAGRRSSASSASTGRSTRTSASA